MSAGVGRPWLGYFSRAGAESLQQLIRLTQITDPSLERSHSLRRQTDDVTAALRSVPHNFSIDRIAPLSLFTVIIAR